MLPSIRQLSQLVRTSLLSGNTRRSSVRRFSHLEELESRTLLTSFAIEISPDVAGLNLGANPYNGDHAEGLAAPNEAAQPNSNATGGEDGPNFNGGIEYDDVTNELTMNFAYGSDFGFTDLTGDFSAAHIHAGGLVRAPNMTNTDGGIIINLVTEGLHNPGTSTRTGSFVGTVTLSEAQEDQLFDNALYFNIHSSTFGAGEIRGQLIPTAELSDLTPAREGAIGFDQNSRRFRLGFIGDNGELVSSQSNPLPANVNGWTGFVGDFDGDTVLDGMALNLDNFRYFFFKNAGDGTFENLVPAGGISPNVTWDFFQVGDYNGDGRDEVLAQIVSGAGAGSVRSQDVNGTSNFYVTLDTGYEALVTGDFNGDEIDDLVGLFDNNAGTRANIIPAISIDTPNGRRMTAILSSGTFGQSVAGGGLTDLTVADYNNDDRDDLALRNANGQIFTATTTGDMRVNAPDAHNFVVSNRAPNFPIANHPQLLAGDFSNDFLADLFTFETDTDRLVTAISSVNMDAGDMIPDGSLVMTRQNSTVFGDTGLYVAGDFDGDGIDDVVSLSVQETAYFRSTGTDFENGVSFAPIAGGDFSAIVGLRAGRVFPAVAAIS